MESSPVIRYLQGWIGVVGFMAIGNTISCFRSHEYLADRLYSDIPTEVTGLSARLFGVWTLLSGALRLYCAFNIRSREIYNLTLVSFFLALFHFVLEVFIYHTAPLTNFGVISPLVISSGSIAWMIVGYWYLDEMDDEIDERALMKKFNYRVGSAGLAQKKKK